MKNLTFSDYQNKIEGHLIRHRSILDIMSKNQDAVARVNRAVAKAVTSCGCIEIHAKKQEIPEDSSLDSMGNYMDNHLTGELCPQCRSIIKDELGNQFFYMTSLANTLGINLDDIILQEEKKMSTLGKYHLR
ncbi:MAG: DUF1573 domain-containing protein [Clostridiales bacterium]|jgi:hypothetical protein|nr:DUF1573 domain-containing protein [Clostridiales bacterium]